MEEKIGVIDAEFDANGRPTNGQMIVLISPGNYYEPEEIDPVISDVELYAMIAYINSQYPDGWHVADGKIVTGC